ncbi:MAG: hypothetical protein AT710_09785 [Thermocladium sp. ECH_B]|nr:MAG: hypothetical protein AT710_09785 [Thermocladium sp. ECH_B]
MMMWRMAKRGRLIVMIVVSIAILFLASGLPVTANGSQNYQVVLNLLNGQQYFGVPHVYQGDNDGSPTSQWPVYYGPNNASQYWSLAGISSNQPVLMMVPTQYNMGSAMFWSETYSGGAVKITIIGTYSSGSSPLSDGFEIYLFLNPTTWGVSPKYNYSIPYTSTVGNGWAYSGYPSPHEGDNILPQSSTQYIVVQWEPYWQIFGTTPGATGQWNVWIVNNINGNNPSIGPSPSPNLGSGYAGWDGIGTGAFQPNPGDRINITVTYNPSTNTLTGIAIDLNTGQSANFTLNLGNYYTPPDSGSYVFGVEGITGAFYANWALLYVAMIGNVKSPLPSPTYYSVVATAVAVIVVLVLIIALLMGRRRKQ